MCHVHHRSVQALLCRTVCSSTSVQIQMGTTVYHWSAPSFSLCTGTTPVLHRIGKHTAPYITYTHTVNSNSYDVDAPFVCVEYLPATALHP